MLVQDHSKYTDADQLVWSTLYHRQMARIREVAYSRFADSLVALHFNENEIPRFEVINRSLQQLTGWQIYAVPGLVDNKDFFTLMYYQQFGVTTWLRKPEQLDYLEEPDMFHDVFGHVPLLADPAVCTFLHGLARIARHDPSNTDLIERLARLYWYTIEFGLIHEDGHLKIFGAGILSSIGETDYCLAPTTKKVPFDMQVIMGTPYIKDAYQQQYFVLDSVEQLAQSLSVLEEEMV